jgi:hypothetical protein
VLAQEAEHARTLVEQYRLDDLTQTSYEPASHVYDREIPSSCLGRSGHSAGIDFDHDRKAAVSEAHALRRKIGPELIHTRRGLGYVLEAEGS